MRADCPNCGSDVRYNVFYEVAYCLKCDQWLELNCPNINCDLCQSRPEKPSLCNKNMLRRTSYLVANNEEIYAQKQPTQNGNSL